MKKFLSIVSFLVLLSFNAIAGTKVGEIVGQMGTTWNEREGQTETVIIVNERFSPEWRRLWYYFILC